MVSIDKIPAGARFVMEKLMTAGYEAYLVGGCVRDMFMGAISSRLTPHFFA